MNEPDTLLDGDKVRLAFCVKAPKSIECGPTDKGRKARAKRKKASAS